MLNTYPRSRKGEGLLFWILHTIIKIAGFSANVCQCNIAHSVSVAHVQLWFLNLYIYCLSVSLTRKGCHAENKASDGQDYIIFSASCQMSLILYIFY